MKKNINKNNVLYSVSNIDSHIAKQFFNDFYKLSIEDQKKKKDWVVDRLIEIDNNTFDTQKYLYSPIRFWYQEYRTILYLHFNHI